MGQNYPFRTNKIAEIRKHYFLGRFGEKIFPGLGQQKFFQVWWSQIFDWKNFRKNEIVSKPLYITFKAKMRRFRGFWAIFIFCSKLTWVKTIFFVQIRSPECENITFWVDLRQKNFSRFGGLKFLAGKIFEKVKSSLNPFISLFRQKCVDSEGFERFLFFAQNWHGSKLSSIVQIRPPKCENNTFWVDLRQKKIFQVWWSQIFGWKKFRKKEIVSKPLFITF